MARQGFDPSRLSTGPKIVGISAPLFFAVGLLAPWYRCCATAGGGGPNGNALTSTVTKLALLLSLAAIAGVALTAFGIRMKGGGIKPGMVQLAVAVAALALTLLGVVWRPDGWSPSWGGIAGGILAGVWAYGAFMWNSEPDVAAPGAE